MAASRQTVSAIYDVLTRYVQGHNVEQMLTDLKNIEGNRSFHDTINAIIQVHLSRK